MNAYQDIRELLNRISSDDRITCLKVASALKNELGNSGFELFQDFCRKSEKYEEAWVRANWKAVDEQKATVGILHFFANRLNDTEDATHRSVQVIKRIGSRIDTDKAAYAKEIWNAACPDQSLVAKHPYVVKKEFNSAAPARRCCVSGSLVGNEADCLIVPVQDIRTKELQSVQCINAEGMKQNFGPVKGGALILGDSSLKDVVWAVAEGWASAAACIKWHGFKVAVCSFGKHSLRTVAQEIAEFYRPVEVRVLLEDDS